MYSGSIHPALNCKKMSAHINCNGTTFGRQMLAQSLPENRDCMTVVSPDGAGCCKTETMYVPSSEYWKGYSPCHCVDKID